jgi:nucleotide-binding universal stress UspA family protein
VSEPAVDHCAAPVFRRIVVGVDGGEGGRDALALATVLQRACGGELLVADPSSAGALHASADDNDADLLVVAGDVGPDAVHAASCPVAVAPRGYGVRDTALRTIGVGCDGSAESLGALALARRIAEAAGGSLRAYTVVAPPLPMWPATAEGPGRSEIDAAIRRRGRARLGAALADVGEREFGYPVVGNAATELTRRSGHLHLLVVGSRSHGPLRRLMLGSTSRRLMRQAACPVLVLPRGAQVPATVDGAVAR